jgi:opacity protein-like surface antigen
MKRKLFAACVGFFASGAAFAADYPPPAPPVQYPQFSGFYAAGGGGFGVSTWRNYSMSEFYSSDCCFASGNASGQVAPQGWLGTAAAGYNMQYGSWLGGLELSGRWGEEGAERHVRSIILRNGAPQPGAVDHNYQFRSDAGVSLAVRAGIVLDRTLIFGKLGVGIAHAEDRFSFQGSGIVCIPSCSPIGSAELSVARWSPSLVAGVGLEHNIGRLFLRVGADLEGIYGLKGMSVTPPSGISPGGNASGSASSEDFWTTRGTALVGFRF